jgi:hypothetical protein
MFSFFSTKSKTRPMSNYRVAEAEEGMTNSKQPEHSSIATAFSPKHKITPFDDSVTPTPFDDSITPTPSTKNNNTFSRENRSKEGEIILMNNVHKVLDSEFNGVDYHSTVKINNINGVINRTIRTGSIAESTAQSTARKESSVRKVPSRK